jgi:hypothetical protein
MRYRVFAMLWVIWILAALITVGWTASLVIRALLKYLGS